MPSKSNTTSNTQQTSSHEVSNEEDYLQLIHIPGGISNATKFTSKVKGHDWEFTVMQLFNEFNKSNETEETGKYANIYRSEFDATATSNIDPLGNMNGTSLYLTASGTNDDMYICSTMLPKSRYDTLRHLDILRQAKKIRDLREIESQHEIAPSLSRDVLDEPSNSKKIYHNDPRFFLQAAAGKFNSQSTQANRNMHQLCAIGQNTFLYNLSIYTNILLSPVLGILCAIAHRDFRRKYKIASQDNATDEETNQMIFSMKRYCVLKIASDVMFYSVAGIGLYFIQKKYHCEGAVILTSIMLGLMAFIGILSAAVQFIFHSRQYSISVSKQHSITARCSTLYSECWKSDINDRIMQNRGTSARWMMTTIAISAANPFTMVSAIPGALNKKLDCLFPSSKLISTSIRSESTAIGKM